MKDYLTAEVDGRKFFKTYILFFIPILFLSIISTPQHSRGFGLQILSLAESYLTMLLQFSFFCYLITTVTFRDTGFPFTASLGHFAPRGALWFFLSTITAGLYGPWFTRNYTDFVLENLSWNGKQARFLGQPRKLLLSMFLYFYLPILVISAFFIPFYIRAGEVLIGGDWMVAAVPGLLVLILSMLFYHVFLRWLVNLEYSGYRITFRSTPGETFKMLAGQMFLSVITLFIYSPAACIRMYTFVTGRISFEDEQGDSRATLGFDGNLSEGFRLFWGQILLSIITIGIYGPWAMARISNWIMNNTYLEGDLDI